MSATGFDLICERFTRERQEIAARHEHLRDRWVIYTRVGVVADFPNENQAMRVAMDSHGEEEFLVDQILPERPVVFIGGGGGVRP